MRKPHTEGHEILEKMPLDPAELATRFRNMSASEFDAVCVSAITYVIEDQQTDNGFISVKAVAIMLAAMRDRYRRIAGDAEPYRLAKLGTRNPSAKLNELQVRIIRRIRHSRKRHLAGPAIAKLFGVNKRTVTEIWAGRLWKHLATLD